MKLYLNFQQRGMTLFEFLIFFILFCLLLYFSFTYLARLREYADDIKARSTFRALLVGVKVARMRRLASSAQNKQTVIIEGIEVKFNRFGWPGEDDLSPKACQDVWNKVLLNPQESQLNAPFEEKAAYGVYAMFDVCVYLYLRDLSPFRGMIYNQETGDVYEFGFPRKLENV